MRGLYFELGKTWVSQLLLQVCLGQPSSALRAPSPQGEGYVLNPELSHMRVPVLSLGILFLFLILIILVIAFLFLRRIRRGNVFEMKSVKNLQAMGWVTLATILPLVALYVYTEKNVSGSITNLYVTVAVLMMGVIAVFFFLIANLFEQAVHYKEENDLTV